jgi:hypothetical protein
MTVPLLPFLSSNRKSLKFAEEALGSTRSGLLPQNNESSILEFIFEMSLNNNSVLSLS